MNKAKKWKCSAPCTWTVYGEHIRKQERNMADRETQPALSGLNLAFGSTLASRRLTVTDKSHTIRKLRHTKTKSTCINSRCVSMHW